MSNMNNHYDVIVIGAGPGGSSAAALLAKAGKKVLLVDKNKSAGGRMSVIHDSQGFHYELFPINCVPANNSRFEYVLEKIGKMGAVKRVEPEKLGLHNYIYFEDKKGKVFKWKTGDFDSSFFKALRIHRFDIPGLLKIKKIMTDMATMPETEIEKLSTTSCADFVDRYGKFPGFFRTFALAAFCEGTLEMTCEQVPASEMIKLFQEQAKNGAGRYYEYGLGHVFEVFAEAVKEFGGTVLFGSRVKSIDTENGRVKGITLENGGQYTAPVIISTAGIRQTVLNLAGEGVFDAAYVKRVKELVPNLACIGYRYFLNAPVLDSPMTVLFPEGCLETYEEFKLTAEGKRGPQKNYIYFGTTSLYPNTAPEGKQLVYAVMSCYADTEIDPRPYLDYIEAKVRKIQPELFDHIDRKEIMTPKQCAAVGVDAFGHSGGEAYGIANSIGQAGKERPRAASPLEGLYFAGNDAGGFGLGTHQAVDSGVRVAEMLLST